MKIKAYRMSTARDFDTWDFGAHFGFTYASTDIAGSNIGFGGKQMSFGLDVTKFLTHSFAIQGRVLTGSLKGLDEGKPLFQYHTKINYDLSLNALFQIGNVSFLSRVPNLALYATIGVGVMKYSPYVSIDGGNTEVHGIYSQYTQPYEYDNYKSSTDLVLPIGMGVKYRVSDKFTITGEYSVRNTKSDKEFVAMLSRAVIGAQGGDPETASRDRVTAVFGSTGFRGELVDDANPARHYVANLAYAFRSGQVLGNAAALGREVPPYCRGGCSMADVRLGLLGSKHGAAMNIGKNWSLANFGIYPSSRLDVAKWIREEL